MFEPVSPSEMPTVSLLYKLNRIHLDSDYKSKYEPKAIYNDKISIIREDITTLAVEAIVNAANPSLLGGGGVDGAIHSAAGRWELRAECEKLGGCDHGDAKITGAYKLPAKKIIHAVGPIYSTMTGTDNQIQLASCYRKSLELAVKHDLRSIAFPAISTGVYGYPGWEASHVALGTVRAFFDEGHADKFDRVVFCTFLEVDENYYLRAVQKYFPKAEKTDESPDGDVKPEAATKESSEADAKEDTAKEADLAAKLPDPPTDEPTSPEGPSSKKQKTTEWEDDFVMVEKEEADEGKDTADASAKPPSGVL